MLTVIILCQSILAWQKSIKLTFTAILLFKVPRIRYMIHKFWWQMCKGRGQLSWIVKRIMKLKRNAKFTHMRCNFFYSLVLLEGNTISKGGYDLSVVCYFYGKKNSKPKIYFSLLFSQSSHVLIKIAICTYLKKRSLNSIETALVYSLLLRFSTVQKFRFENILTFFM